PRLCTHLPLSFLSLLPLPPTSTLFPYTTLFRSPRGHSGLQRTERRIAGCLDVRPDGRECRLDGVPCGIRVGLNRIPAGGDCRLQDRKSTRLNSSHVSISYAVFCLKKKKKKITD